MGNLLRGLATGLLLASVLAITGCDTRPLRIVITDFDHSQVEGVEVWRVDPTGQTAPAGMLSFLEVLELDSGGTPIEVVKYQMVYPDGTAGDPVYAELVRDPIDPDRVDVVLLFDVQAQPGWFRVSTFNAAGSSPLSVDQTYVM